MCQNITALFVTLALLAALSLRALLLACSDIAAVCCDARIVRWQEILSPSYYPPLSKTECAILPDCALFIYEQNPSMIVKDG